MSTACRGVMKKTLKVRVVSPTNASGAQGFYPECGHDESKNKGNSFLINRLPPVRSQFCILRFILDMLVDNSG